MQFSQGNACGAAGREIPGASPRAQPVAEELPYDHSSIRSRPCHRGPGGRRRSGRGAGAARRGRGAGWSRHRDDHRCGEPAAGGLGAGRPGRDQPGNAIEGQRPLRHPQRTRGGIHRARFANRVRGPGSADHGGARPLDRARLRHGRPGARPRRNRHHGHGGRGAKARGRQRGHAAGRGQGCRGPARQRRRPASGPGTRHVDHAEFGELRRRRHDPPARQRLQ